MPTFPLNDFILINKPTGWTSFDAVNFIRKKIRAEHPELKNIKVGHAGTLDPFATGLLIVAAGREATKKIDKFKNLPKTYLAVIHFGAVSDTMDKTGKITVIIRQDGIARAKIEEAIKSFLGPQLQTPPMFSAKKINGKRLYELARQGREIDRKPAPVEIYDIRAVEYSWPILKVKIRCSPGTYIRALAHDIGQKLGVGAYCEELTRTAIGDYRLEEAKNLV